MACDTSAVVNELNKLKKSELIDIIITGKLPEQICENEEIKKMLNLKQWQLEPACQTKVSKCKNKLCLTTIEFKNEQIKMLKRMSEIQEQRASDQELIITLLKDKINTSKQKLQVPAKNENQNNGNQKQDSSNENNALYKEVVQQSLSSKKIEKDTTHEVENKQVKMAENTMKKDGWVTQQRRKKPIYGTATNTQIKASIKYIDFHVYRLEPQTTEEEVKNYLQSNEITTVKCAKMISKYPEEYASFKVSVPENLADKIQHPDTWPRHTCINRFLDRLAKKRQET